MRTSTSQGRKKKNEINKTTRLADGYMYYIRVYLGIKRLLEEICHSVGNWSNSTTLHACGPRKIG